MSAPGADPRALAEAVATADASAIDRRGADTDFVDLGLAYDDTIVTRSARTVDFNGQAFVPRYIYRRATGDGLTLDASTAVLRVVFGLHQDVTLSVIAPWVERKLERDDPPAGEPKTLRASGLGDVVTSVKWRFYQDTGPAQTTEAALIAGIELPTGEDDQTDSGVRLPRPLQPGSGSVDAIIGGAFTRIDGRWLLNSDVVAKINSKADHYRFGNVLFVDVGGHYRAFPDKYERHDQLTLNLVAELNARFAARDQMSGDSVENSGGNELFFTPGVQLIPNLNALVEAAVQVPVLQDLNGRQPETDYVLIVGARVRF